MGYQRDKLERDARDGSLSPAQRENRKNTRIKRKMFMAAFDVGVLEKILFEKYSSLT